jgi:hypothetical protein
LRKIIGPDASFYQDDHGTPNGIDFNRLNKLADFVLSVPGKTCGSILISRKTGKTQN